MLTAQCAVWDGIVKYSNFEGYASFMYFIVGSIYLVSHILWKHHFWKG